MSKRAWFRRREMPTVRNQHKLRWTKAGLIYAAVWIGLLAAGLHQQGNLILLVAGMAAGPLVASYFVSSAMVSKVRVNRRTPANLFASDPLVIDYTITNNRRTTAVLALTIEEKLTPVDSTIPGASPVTPRVSFGRVRAGHSQRIRWQGRSPVRGKYAFAALELVTGSPFGLIERRLILSEPASIIVYPRIGKLSRRWQQYHRESTQTKKGRRHDRTAQQQEYHGLREYRAGDSPRWIHWRTSARIGKPMVKEFEQQNDQDLTILLDPWLPRTKVTPEQREALEAAIRFVATVCLEACRELGKRLVLGWTGPTPGVRQGPASVKLLHELMEHLAVMRPATEGSLSTLFDALPASVLRESIIVIVSTRPVNLLDEAERSERLAGGTSRGLVGRVLLLDASKGDLADLIQFDDSSPSRTSGRLEANP